MVLEPGLNDEANSKGCYVVAPSYGIARLWMGRAGIDPRQARIVTSIDQCGGRAHNRGLVVFVLNDESIDPEIREQLHLCLAPVLNVRWSYRSVDEDMAKYLSNH
jgi:hypothetical protein